MSTDSHFVAQVCACGHDSSAHDIEPPYPCYDCPCTAFRLAAVAPPSAPPPENESLDFSLSHAHEHVASFVRLRVSPPETTAPTATPPTDTWLCGICENKQPHNHDWPIAKVRNAVSPVASSATPTPDARHRDLSAAVLTYQKAYAESQQEVERYRTAVREYLAAKDSLHGHPKIMSSGLESAEEVDTFFRVVEAAEDRLRALTMEPR